MERTAEAFDGGLGRGVVAGSHRGQLSADRGDVHDGAAAAGAHPGQHSLDHRDGAEEVRLEQGAHVGVVAFLDGRAVTVAGVVDQDVDAAEPLLGLLHRGGDLPGIRDVERDGEHPLRGRVGQIGDPGDIARGDDSVVACADDRFGECIGRVRSNSR